MDLQQLLATTPESLAREQFRALKDDTIDTLKEIINYIQTDQYVLAEAMLAFSASGDGYGEDNYYIAFHCGDIGETISKLNQLYKQSKSGSLI